MADAIRYKRGNDADRPALGAGEPGLSVDSKTVYVGLGTGDAADDVKLANVASSSAQNLYVATTAYGGDSVSGAGRTGLALISSTATTGTSGANLRDSTGPFTTAHVGKTVYNVTDDTWAKIASWQSSTQITLSDAIMADTEDYIICDSIDNIQEAFNSIIAPFNSATTVLISDGTYSGDVEFTGKTAGGAFNLTVQGSTSGTTTISGETTMRQRIFLSDLTFTKRIFQYAGADVDWTTVVTSGDDGFIINKAPSITSNVFRTTSVVIFESDPGAYTNIASTVTIGYTIYTATAVLGGSDSLNDGLKITQGSATATTANKLIDSTANFNSGDHLNKTVYNSTDDTWAEITAIDSTTTVSLDNDIMASGESYEVGAAKLTIQEATNAIPGTNNSNVTVRISDGTFAEAVTIQGKTFSGSFGITYQGTKTVLDSLTATGASVQGSGATQGTVDRSAGTWTGSARQHKWVRFTAGNNDGEVRPIDDNSTTLITIVGVWAGAIGSDTYVVEGLGTIVQPASGNVFTLGLAQVGIAFRDLDLEGDSSGYGVQAASNSAASLTRCYSDPGIFAGGGSLSSTHCVYIGGARFNRVVYAATNGSISLTTCKVGVNVASSTGVLPSGLCSVNIREGTILDGSGAATSQYGVQAQTNTQFDCFTGGSFNRVQNWTVAGLRGESGAQGFLTATGVYVNYSGNGTDISVDANSSHIN